MAEILVVALPDIEDFLLEVVGRGAVCLALGFMTFSPVLELVLSAAVKGLLAFAALKESFLVADLTTR